MMEQLKRRKAFELLRLMILFAMFGAMMFISKIIMEFLPNVHLIGMMIVTLTLVYRVKALIPIYIFVGVTGLFYFGVWWFPYLYIWAILWAMSMFLPSPKRISRRWGMLLYASVCALHGFFYGALYAPVQALMYGMGWQGMIAWIIAGIPFDIIHGISNFAVGLLIYPMATLLMKLENKSRNKF